MSARTILVVEDDEGMRLAVERLLHAGGYLVSTFDSAEALLGSEEIWHAGCLVLDVRLPGLSGVELSQRLASVGLELPIIFMTAHDDPRTHDEALASRPVAYLHKPF